MGVDDLIPDDAGIEPQNSGNTVHGKQHYSHQNTLPDIDHDAYNNDFLYWLGGFFDGEGSISFSVTKDKSTRIGYRVNLLVRMSQHKTEMSERIFKFVIDEIELGKLYYEESQSEGQFLRFRMGGITDAMLFLELIQPYVRIKQDEVDDALEIAEKIKEGKHLTEDGIIEITEDIEDFITNNRTETRSRTTLKHGSDKLRKELG